MKRFYDSIRTILFNGRLTQSQVDGINHILTAFKRHNIADIRFQAYMLATVFHETDKTMQPIEEYGRGRGKRYGRKIMFSGRPYEVPDELYYGRGHVQLTWYENYKRFGELLNIPLLEQPELALKSDISADIMIIGMTKGLFTGVGLNRYFNYKEDPVNARRIINGFDKAQLIAEYYYKFKEALQ